MRDDEQFSSFGKPLSNGRRNRDLESAQDSQTERQRFLSEQRGIHDFVEKKADQAFLMSLIWTEESGECTMLILHFMKLACSSNLRGWNFMRQILID